MFSPARIILLALLALPLFSGEDDGGEAAVKHPARAAPIPKPVKPLKVPGGEAQPGWELLLKNDFAAAETAFNEALKKKPEDLEVLEGLRAAMMARGRYAEAQKVNLRMVEAAANNPLCGAFAARVLDVLGFAESHAGARETFARATAAATPQIAAGLKDNLATLYYRINKPDEARKALEGLGYVDRWQFVVGPFGAKDKNNVIERRFAPERFLKTLEFSEGGEKLQVHKDVKVLNRDLNLGALYPGAKGVFYAFTNLESDSDQDIILGVSAATAYRAYLRGYPILSEPEDEHRRRSGGELVRARLTKGSNPLLVKVSGTVSLTVRVLGADYGPANTVRVKPAMEQELAAHAVIPARGQLFSQKIRGMMAEHFLKKFGGADKGGLGSLADSGALAIAEAAWLDIALQRENDVPARVALARAVAGSFPDSANALDLAAVILKSAGTAMGNSEGREGEESRRLREQALAKVPDSHQHLLALYYFFLERDLADQALEKIKACAAAHPESPLAQAELGAAYQRKQFIAEAEKCFEKSAALDEAYLPRLAGFHEMAGNRVRARELNRKLAERGRLDPATQFDLALRRSELDIAEKILAEQEKFFPERKDDLAEDRARLLLEKGNAKEAYALRKKLYETQPRYHANRRAALVALVDLAVRLEKDDEACAALKAYLKDHAGDAELRQRLSELEGSVLPRWWEPYDVKVPEIDTSRFTNANYPAANHAWIVDFMVTRILPDFSAESYVHIAQKVLNVQGINELSELLVQAQRQDMVYVRTLNPDGSVFQPQNVHDFNLAQTASLYKVGPGSILEHAYVMQSPADEDDPNFRMGFNFCAIDAPRAVSRWVVMVPDGVKSKLEIRKIRPEFIEEKTLPGPPGHTVYQWTNSRVEGIKFEPLMPNENDQEVIPLVMIDMPNRPFRANTWLMRREKNEIPAEAAEEARRVVSPALFKKLDDAAKFDAIVNWVRLNIQPGNDSRTLTDVWFSRAGRADQMTALAREMALIVGLSVRTAHVNGSYVPGRVWHSKNARHAWEPAELASFGNGGRMLVLEQRGGPDRWAQFIGRSPRHHWPWDLNANQGGALALTLGDDGARIKRVRGEALGLANASHRIEVALDAAGAGAVSGALLLFGHTAGFWREALADPQRQNQIRESVVRSSWPKSLIKDVSISGLERADLPLNFSYTCSVPGLSSEAPLLSAAGEAKSAGAFFLPPFLNAPRVLDLRGPPERENDLLLKDEFADLDQTITYLAPEGHGWVEVPDDIFVCTEFGFYLADYNVQGRALTCTRSYLLPAQRVSPAQYPRLQEFLQKVSAAQQRIAYAPLHAENFGSHRRDIFSPGYAGYGEDEGKRKK